MKRFSVTLLFVSAVFWSYIPFLADPFSSLAAQETQDAQVQDSPAFSQGFALDFVVGSDLLSEKSDSSNLASWTRFGIQPGYSSGSLRVSLDFSVRFIIDQSAAAPYSIYTSDWVPSEGSTFLDVYVPKIMRLEYGKPGVDPLYVSVSPIESLTFGQGFIVSGYSNTDFLPKRSISGLRLGIDGAGLHFPYLGLEAMTGNLARLDILAARAYVRPMAFLHSSILKDAELGATIAVDRAPLSWIGEQAASGLASEKPIFFYGADICVPVMNTYPFAVKVSGGWAQEANKSQGLSFGLQSTIVGFIEFGGEVRFLQEGFLPSYFDANYDFYRASRFNYMATSEPGRFFSAWASHFGFAFAQDRVNVDFFLDGRFAAVPGAATDNSGQYPHFKCDVTLLDGLLEGLSLQLSYERFFIGRAKAWAWDITNVEGTRFGFDAHYDVGDVVVSLSWANGWDPINNKIDTFAGLAATVHVLGSRPIEISQSGTP